MRFACPPRVALEVRPSSIDGKGVFAVSRIGPRKKIGEFGGELISLREGRRRARRRRRIAIVELDDGKAIDAARDGNEFRYLNHSCSPNTFIRIVGTRVEFYSLRGIRVGEELTCDYGESHHEGKRRCRCGSEHCRRFI
jgi:SET domain-containing protein